MKRTIVASLLILSNAGLYAGSMGEVSNSNSSSWYAQINASLDWIRGNGTQDLSLVQPFYNTYTGKQEYKQSGGLGLGFGLEREAWANLFWQLGLAGYFNTAIQAQGAVTQFRTPEFVNYYYRYNVQSSRLVAAAKLLGSVQQKYHPYIAGELGAAFNRSYSYIDTAILAVQPPIASFTDKNHASFTWGVGVGVDVDLRSNLRLGMGYQFSDLGRSRLGFTPVQSTGDYLGIAHLYDNQLKMQLTALL